MRSPFAYTPRFGPLQAASPGAAVAYLGAWSRSPSSTRARWCWPRRAPARRWPACCAGAGGAVRAALRMSLTLALLIVVVNALVVDRGETVLLRLGELPLLGQVNVTAEALAAGAVIGLRAAVAMVAFAVYSACVDPDRVLRALRPFARHSALTATLISRLVPVAAADASPPARRRPPARPRRGTAGTSGAGAPPPHRLPRPRGRRRRDLGAPRLLPRTSAPQTLDLDFLQARTGKSRSRRSRYDRRFYLTGAIVLLAAIGGKLAGADGFHAYPTIELEFTPATLIVCGAGGPRRLSPRDAGSSAAGGAMPELATPPRAAPALAVERLTYAYPGGDSRFRAFTSSDTEKPGNALREVSLTLAPGEFAILAGRSACGKTTLLRAACGLVPHFHGGEIEGRVEVAGIDALANGPGELAAAVGYVAQDPETQIVSTTVAAEIALPLEMRGDLSASRARAVEEVALALAIPHLLDRTVDTLSGGELQRVALAAALVTRPRLVLLDEPTSQLDPVAGDELIWLLRRLNEEWGVTILLAEHRLERCLAAADRVVAMDSGAVSFDGTSERLPRLGPADRHGSGDARQRDSSPSPESIRFPRASAKRAKS